MISANPYITEPAAPYSPQWMDDFADPKTVGRYEIIQKLGQGGTAVVYLGGDRYIRRHVAVKMSQPSSHRARARFFVEAESAGRLNHRNIVSIYDAGIHNDYCYMIMEYVRGTTLKRFCHKANLLPVNNVLQIVFSVSRALSYAHSEGVIHRDIKPSNIMLDEAGTPKLTDFGIAQTTGHTVEMGILGTPSYMSPEQVEDVVVGNESDIFSLGCVLYELLTGQPAFSGSNNFSIMYQVIHKEPKSILDIRPDLPEVLDAIVKKAMAKNPRERYQTCMDLAHDLRLALAGSTDVVQDKGTKDVVDYVSHVPFFRDFSDDQIGQLVLASSIIRVTNGEVIVAEGELDDTFYVILSGRASVKKGNKDIAFINEGECFGEMACISGQARIATVTAASECILMKISSTLLQRSSESIRLLFFQKFATTLVSRFARTSGTDN